MYSFILFQATENGGSDQTVNKTSQPQPYQFPSQVHKSLTNELVEVVYPSAQPQNNLVIQEEYSSPELKYF